jgi:hypothetical protein
MQNFDQQNETNLPDFSLDKGETYRARSQEQHAGAAEGFSLSTQPWPGACQQFLGLCLVSSKLGCLDSQTISFGLQRNIFGCKVIHLSLQQRLVDSSLSSNLWLPKG